MTNAVSRMSVLYEDITMVSLDDCFLLTPLCSWNKRAGWQNIYNKNY